MWTAEMDSSNIIIFITDCFAANDAFENLSVEICDIEDLVVPAILYVDCRNGKQSGGKFRLQKIIEKVLESGHDLDWVSAGGESISRVFTSGPSQKLLEHCQRKHESLRQDQPLRNGEEVCENTLEKKVRKAGFVAESLD
jgi:predicted ATP-grasp superfamily ATP-dependent carboligase